MACHVTSLTLHDEQISLLHDVLLSSSMYIDKASRREKNALSSLPESTAWLPTKTCLVQLLPIMI